MGGERRERESLWGVQRRRPTNGAEDAAGDIDSSPKAQHLLDLQRSAGNAAVTGAVAQRSLWGDATEWFGGGGFKDGGSKDTGFGGGGFKDGGSKDTGFGGGGFKDGGFKDTDFGGGDYKDDFGGGDYKDDTGGYGTGPDTGKDTAGEEGWIN